MFCQAVSGWPPNAVANAGAARDDVIPESLLKSAGIPAGTGGGTKDGSGAVLIGVVGGNATDGSGAVLTGVVGVAEGGGTSEVAGGVVAAGLGVVSASGFVVPCVVAGASGCKPNCARCVLSVMVVLR